MKLDYFDHDKLFVDKTNMRHGRKAPDVADILPTIRKRGVIVPLIVKPPNAEGLAGIVAGARRWTADGIARAEGIEHGPLPCAILEQGDDAAAIEASLIENIARLDPDEVTQWETFTRLVKEGRTVEDISETFGLPELAIRRVLALGNLLPRIRSLYAKEEIDRTSIRHLTMASKAQQQAWLRLRDDPEQYAPVGHQLKAWLLGGQSISAAHALFDIEQFDGALVSDLFGEDRYFADADQFWAAQNAAIEARRLACLEAGWSDAVIMGPAEHFHDWEYQKTPKRKGGKVYIDVQSSGHVAFHEGYLSRAELRAKARGQESRTEAKLPRPEISGPMHTYIDLHRHAAVRAALCAHPGAALRLMVAHAISASPLWSVKVEEQVARSDEVANSLRDSRGETVFAGRRIAALALLDMPSEQAHLTMRYGGEYSLVGLFHRLLGLSDESVLAILSVVMGETLAAGSDVVEPLAAYLEVDMADWWEADATFFELVRDREVTLALVAEVAGETIAKANAKEKGKALKAIVRDHLEGTSGRPRVERWVPRWMRFPPAAYTERGGVGTVAAHARAEAAKPEPRSEAEPDEVEAVESEAETQPLAA